MAVAGNCEYQVEIAALVFLAGAPMVGSILQAK